MMNKAWRSIKEVPYCFPRSSSKFQGHTGQNIANFDPNWAFPNCNSSLNSPMDLKWCTKFDVVKEKCHIVFRDNPSNFNVTQAEKLTIWIQCEITRPVAAIKSFRFALFDNVCIKKLSKLSLILYIAVTEIYLTPNDIRGLEHQLTVWQMILSQAPVCKR